MRALTTPGDIIPLGEEAQVHVLLVDIDPHAEVTEQVSPLLMAVIMIVSVETDFYFTLQHPR